eukprot:403344995
MQICKMCLDKSENGRGQSKTFKHSQSVGKLHTLSQNPYNNSTKNQFGVSASKKKLRNNQSSVHKSMIMNITGKNQNERSNSKNQSFNRDIQDLDNQEMNAMVQRNMRDYQRKGLLDIVDRDNHNQGCSACLSQKLKMGPGKANILICTHNQANNNQRITTITPANKIRGSKSSALVRHNQNRPRSAMKNESRVARKPSDQLGYSTNNPQLSYSMMKNHLQQSPTNDNDLNFYSSQSSKLVQGQGKEALKSIQEIRKSLANPQLLSYKISSEQGNVWRNAYYLSTSIEESNVRKSISQHPQQQQQLATQQTEQFNLDYPMHTQQVQNTVSSPRSIHQAPMTRNEPMSASFLDRQSLGGGSLSQRPASGVSRQGLLNNPNDSEVRRGKNTILNSGNQQPNIQSYLDFNTPTQQNQQKNFQSHNFGSLSGGGAHQERNYSQKSLHQLGSGQVVNPCPQHIMNEIAFLDKTTKRGACSECIPELTKQNHELMPLNATVFEIRDVMMNLECNMLDLLRQRTALLNDNKNKMAIIETDQSQFVQEQQNKINQLHNYLEDRLRIATNDYQKAIEPDTFKVKSNLNRLEEQISMNKQFISEVQAIKREFDQGNTKIQNIVEKVQVAGNLLNQYNSLRSKQNDDQFETVYPNHLRDFLPVFEINTDKELEIMANKFRVLTHHMQNLNQQQNSLIGSLVTSPTKQNLLGAAPSSGFFNQAPFKSTNSLMMSQQQTSPHQMNQSLMRQSLQQQQQQLQSNYQEMTQKTQKDEKSMMDDLHIETKEDFYTTHLNEIGSGSAFLNKQRAGIMQQTIQNNQTTNRASRGNLFDQPQIMRRKIKILRWLSKKIGEYDIDNDYWQAVDAQVDRPFLAFSRTIYLPNQDMIVIGGLDDFIPNKPTFSAQCILISEVPLNSYDNLYVQNPLKSMISKRGCFAAIFHEGQIFVMGGLNYTEKILKKCERYNIAENKWETIADMCEPRKNASACALTTDTIYVFGGSNQSQSSDTIEQYSIATNTWNLLKIKLPSPISFLTSFKFSQTQIILLGGSVKEHSRKAQTYKTNQVLVFDVIQPKFTRVKNLERDLISLYPAFFDSGILYMIDEDGDSENPPVLRYDMSYIMQLGQD